MSTFGRVGGFIPDVVPDDDHPLFAKALGAQVGQPFTTESAHVTAMTIATLTRADCASQEEYNMVHKATRLLADIAAKRQAKRISSSLHSRVFS